MTKDEYAEYLRSEHWQQMRARALYYAQNRCQSPLCWLQRSPAQHRVEVHHLTYERLGREWADDLIVLCVDCHRQQHGLPPAPLTPERPTFAELGGTIIEDLNRSRPTIPYQSRNQPTREQLNRAYQRAGVQGPVVP